MHSTVGTDDLRPRVMGGHGQGLTSRRKLLAGVGALASAGLSGCLGGLAPRSTTDGPDAEDGTRRTTRDDANVTVAQTGLPPNICEEEIRDNPGIYAVLEPAFGADWSGIDVSERYGHLPDDEVVIGVESDGQARAYPLSILFWHEIVNDTVGGSPILVTYCPLCKSGLVASREVGGAQTEFLVSGLLWQPERLQVAISEHNGTIFGADRYDTEARVRQHGNLVMYDRATRSYWSQIMAQAICGPLTGTRLSVVPSTVTTWGAWRRNREHLRVLLPPPASHVATPPD